MHNKILVVNIKNLEIANDFCNQIGAIGKTFNIPLFNKNSIIVGFWCGWNVTNEQLNAILLNDSISVFDSRIEALEFTGYHTANTDDEKQKADQISNVIE